MVETIGPKDRLLQNLKLAFKDILKQFLENLESPHLQKLRKLIHYLKNILGMNFAHHNVQELTIF